MKTTIGIAVIAFALAVGIFIFARCNSIDLNRLSTQTQYIEIFRTLAKVDAFNKPVIFELDKSQDIKLYHATSDIIDKNGMPPKELIAVVTTKSNKDAVLSVQPPLICASSANSTVKAMAVYSVFRWMQNEHVEIRTYEIKVYFEASINSWHAFVTPFPAKPDGDIDLKLLPEADGAFHVQIAPAIGL